jgi:hypothetical protein
MFRYGCHLCLRPFSERNLDRPPVCKDCQKELANMPVRERMVLSARVIELVQQRDHAEATRVLGESLGAIISVARNYSDRQCGPRDDNGR